MPTLQDVAIKVLAQLAIDGHALLGAQWAKDKYKDLLRRCKLNQARRTGTLTIPPNLTTGTVSVTTNTTTVTGNSAAQTAWAAEDTLIGWHIRLGSVWYRIVGQSTTTLTLATPYTETTLSGATYVARQREFELPTDVKRLGLFVHQRLHTTLYPRNLDAIILPDPARTQLDGGPQIVADLGNAPSGAKLIEVYPGSTSRETLDYLYWTFGDSLGYLDPLPNVIDADALAEGVKIHAYEWLAARAAQANQLELAAWYRNNADRQRGIWDSYKRELIQQDGVMEDVTFVVAAAQRGGVRDIQSAHDYIWNTPLTS